VLDITKRFILVAFSCNAGVDMCIRRDDVSMTSPLPVEWLLLLLLFGVLIGN